MMSRERDERIGDLETTIFGGCSAQFIVCAVFVSGGRVVLGLVVSVYPFVEEVAKYISYVIPLTLALPKYLDSQA